MDKFSFSWPAGKSKITGKLNSFRQLKEVTSIFPTFKKSGSDKDNSNNIFIKNLMTNI